MNEMNQSVMQQQHFLLPDVRCAGCCLKIEKALNQMSGVGNITVNYAEKRLSFTALNADTTDQVVQKLDELGYESLPEQNAESLSIFRDQRNALLARLGVAGIGMMQVMMYALASYMSGAEGIQAEYELLMRWASLVIAVPVVFYSALPFHQGAVRDVKNLSPGMDVPVSLAILSAFALSTAHTLSGTGEVYFDSACMFTFFLLTGRYLELVARHSFHVDQSLGEHLLPEEARLLDGRMLPLTELTIGNQILVRTGEVIAADGAITSGVTTVDESAFTGEAAPVRKVEGTRVLAGTRNLDGDITVEVTSTQVDWVITHLGELYKRASGYKPHFAVIADVVARYFVAAVLVLAFGSGLFWWWQGAENYFAIALSVLVVSCPCALSLATPVAYSIASGALSRSGMLIGKGEFLEKLSAVSAIVFDKTGTLTEGELVMRDTIPIDDTLEPERAVQIAASLETGSLHPVAMTIIKHADQLVSVSGAEIEPGLGARGIIGEEEWRVGKPEWASTEKIAQPDTNVNWVLLSRNGKGVCWFSFIDTLRDGARGTVQDFLSSGLHVEIYTGDSSRFGKSMIESLGIENPRAGMTPDDKMAGLQELQRRGHKVLMIGDGLNDAGAMGLADTSVAVNPVDSLVQSASDATLVSGDLQLLPRVVRYAHKVKATIRQNVTWALLYNFTVIPLAIAGLIAPWMAALGMSLSSLLVTLNATRLGRAP